MATLDEEQFCGLCDYEGNRSEDSLCPGSSRKEKTQTGVCYQAKMGGKEARFLRIYNSHHDKMGYEKEVLNRSVEEKFRIIKD